MSELHGNPCRGVRSNKEVPLLPLDNSIPILLVCCLPLYPTVHLCRSPLVARCFAVGRPNQHSWDSDTACRFHTAPPIFHDTKKGWSCCEKRVYDWDEFEQLEGGGCVPLVLYFNHLRVVSARRWAGNRAGMGKRSRGGGLRDESQTD